MSTEPIPYPFVYVEDDGSARELHAAERAYLETKFHPADGDRPYIKRAYQSLDGWRRISGFMERGLVPVGAVIAPAPTTDPTRRIPPVQLFTGKRGKKR